jgi:hypothetical protein
MKSDRIVLAVYRFAQPRKGPANLGGPEAAKVAEQKLAIWLSSLLYHLARLFIKSALIGCNEQCFVSDHEIVGWRMWRIGSCNDK